MTLLASPLVYESDWLRMIGGTTVVFRGVECQVLVEDAPGNKTGAGTLNEGVYGAFIASSAGKLFKFSPLLFKPFADWDAPDAGETLTWHGYRYYATAPDFEDLGPTETGSVLFYGLRDIGNQYGDTADTEGTYPMAISATLTRTLAFGGVSVGVPETIPNADAGFPLEKIIPVGATDFEISGFSLTVANLQAYGIDVSADTLTVKINNATTPAQTLVVTPKSHPPVRKGDGGTSWLTATTISAFFVTNPGTNPVTLRFVGIPDLTPTG